MTNSRIEMKLMLLALCVTFITSQEESISPYEEIKKFIKTFKPGGMNASTYYLLSIDEKHNNLVVGARKNVFLVNLDDMESYEYWNVPQQPGNDAFVKLMLPFGDRILLCWVETPSTGSCTWRNRTTLGEAPESIQGYVFKPKEKYNAPSSSPDQNDTAIITDVDFVKSFEIGPYVYFFFRERSLECESCGKVKTSRVARVCQGDRGGEYRLLGTFVTFQKAKLMCSDGNNYTLNFNEIQDVWWDNHTGQFYAAYSSQPNGPAISAICIYSLSSINRIFSESDFKSFTSETKGWTKKRNKIGEFFPGCKVNPKYLKGSLSAVADGVMATRDMLSSAYGDLIHDPLMDDGVGPVKSKAWFIRDGIRMTGISLDVVGQNIVVYASTDRGSVVKISQPPGISQPCLYSEMEVYPSNKREVIKTMVIDQDRHVLYLGTRYSLTQLSLDQCERYQHDKSACISAADPYCGWDDKTLRCSSVLSLGERLHQNLTICPQGRKETSWSSWRTCVQSDGNLCRCQTRRCQDKGNTPCLTDVEVRLENCTVDLSVGWEGERSWENLGVQHGNWCAWGNWGECSTETWAGLRNRSRTCTSPVPRRGGRTCVGDSIQYEPCSQESQGVQHGNWSEWGNWSECWRETWAGVRNRSRTCTSPMPRNGGRTCVGDSIQYEPCSQEGISGRPQGSHPSDSGCTGPIIGAAVTIFVFAVFCLAAIYCMNRRRTYQFPGDTFANHALL
ncbi:semaphorin-5B-like isoform X2 [Acropora millepora]|uniref:semaphorin-5B-like isoform X2 n=1 Tax=Acropora millepora TaxID=45264 RepID=UPI001CF545B4|nr:semaphorin-5B-like isoform X2 [Acropora millepora]